MVSYIAGLATCADLVQSRQKLRAIVPESREPQFKFAAPIVPLNSIMCLFRFDPMPDSPAKDFVTAQPMDHYDVLIVFPHLNFTAEPIGKSNQPIDVLPGVVQYYQKPDYNRNPVAVTCSCHDYYFAWNYYNSLIYARSGPAFQTYARTDGKALGTQAYIDKKGVYHGQPNSLKVPGVCKHLVKCIDAMKDSNFLVV